jgi:LmbE family N-acetylglucosaminyl deacetylase
MNTLLRNIYHKALPAKVRTYLDFFLYLRQRTGSTAVLEEVGGPRILSLSPHPDDDVLGCGGALYLQKLKGAEVVSVCFTDGRKGAKGSYSEDAMADVRKEEAKRAAKVLGISEMCFLGERDHELVPRPEVISALSGIIDGFAPTSIFLPSIIDGHSDHLATNSILVQALQKYKGAPLMCYQYELWTPILPNCMVDITDIIDVKKKAVLEFKSQTSQANLLDAIMGLSKYRSVLLLNGDRYVESFVETTQDEYVRLWKAIN